MLIILDGFGYNRSSNDNAVANARMSFYNSLLKKNSHTLLKASSEDVGLPKNTMGNSEVGHLNIGAGRVVLQHGLRINQAIADKSFFKNKTLLSLFKSAKNKGKAVHIAGLLSDAGVHSYISHLLALIKISKSMKVKTYLHLFTDGRDMDPHSSLRLIKKAEKAIGSSKAVRIATIAGRYYGMDRDNRWNRTKKSYDSIINATGLRAPDPSMAIKSAYARGESDEFIMPTAIGNYAGLSNNDYFLFMNFRADRARQLCWAFSKKSFVRFRVSTRKINLATMTLYDKKNLKCPVAFTDEKLKNFLSEVISKLGLRQLHIAETEKYAHVTYFFNGRRERPFPKEDRILVHSPKISTYDKKPEMSAIKITEKAIEGVKKGKYAFIVINYANPDMVGHTGDFDATKKALKSVDECLKSLITSALRKKYVVALTADHGNCEQMSKGFTTSHTQNKVPFIIMTGTRSKLKCGRLCDIAPTLLKLMGIQKPKEMTGHALFG